jgi:hypothetical protein
MKLHPAVPAAALILILALLRLPFLDAGYGVNVDAWRVANVARQLATTGEYEVSRLPGYPVQEMVCALFWRGGPAALNALSAMFSLAAALAVWAIGRECKCRDSLLLALALGCTPVFFINSVTAKDYVWAVSFVLWALWAALKNKPVLCGILLGLAIGCRITSGAMMLPLAMILWRAGGDRKGKALLKFILPACGVGAICFLPVWLRYGTGFFTFYDNHERPDLETIFCRGTLDVWGELGLIGLLISSAAAITGIARKQNENEPSQRLRLPLLAMIALYLFAYWKLPDQAGYLIPIIPAALLLISLSAPRWATQVLCGLLIASPWISLSGGHWEAGAIIQDQRERRQTLTGVNGFLSFCRQKLGPDYVVAVGAWKPIIKVLSPQESANFPYLLSRDQAEKYIQNGRHLAYASESIRAFNLRTNHFDLAAAGAVDVHALFLQGRH